MNEQELIWSAIVAWMSAKGIEMLKLTRWFPWLNEYSETANRWVARVVALAATFGLHSSFDAAAGTLVISGLTLPGIFQAVGEYAKQYMFQEISYKKFVREDTETKRAEQSDRLVNIA